MNRIKVNTNFYLDEFVDPHTFFNTEDNGLSLLDNRLFDIAQLLRYHNKGPLMINNWWSYYNSIKDVYPTYYCVEKIEQKNKEGNIHIWSGYRSDRCLIGAKSSAHKLGKAIDPKGDEKELYRIVKNNADVFYSLGLRRIEDINITHGWLHGDTLERNTKPNSIRVVDRVKHVRDIKF